MTPSRMLRPVLVCLAMSGAGLTTSSCGMVDSDPHRFETMARSVADIPLDGPLNGRAQPSQSAPIATAQQQGLRPALDPNSNTLKVEVMDPHDLWDARDAGLRGAIQQTVAQAAPAVIEAAAPVVARAVMQQVSTRTAEPASIRTGAASGLRPAISRTVAETRTTIQLGAYSSEAAARSAWTAVNAGAARQALKGLSPVFETVAVNGRALTRLKVAAPATAAVAICRAANVTDPWCARRT